MLTGRLPFEASEPVALSQRILASDPAPITAHVPTLPIALADVVARALCRERSGRIPSLEALARELEPYAGTSYDAASDGLLSPPPRRSVGFSSSDDTRVLTRGAQTPRPAHGPRSSHAPRASASLAATPLRATRALPVTRPLHVPLSLTELAPESKSCMRARVANWLLGVAMLVVASLFGVGVYHALPPATAPSLQQKSWQQKSWVTHAGVRVRAVVPEPSLAGHDGREQQARPGLGGGRR